MVSDTIVSATARGPIAPRSSVSRQHPLPFASVLIDGGFWGRWQRLNGDVNLPLGWRSLEAVGAMDNFRNVAADGAIGHRGEIFQDSDFYKWLEAACWQLALPHDRQLEDWIDSAIELISRAQAPDGYLNTAFQARTPEPRWEDLTWGHELYCAGHLFQAAVAHYRVTADDRLLAVARRFADHICDVFGADGRPGLCGHPEIEMAFVELYRETGQQRYLDQAALFIDRRGHGLLGRGLGGSAYFQDHIPVRQAVRVEGHAVRQLYLTCGVVDLYLETGERELLDVSLRQWEDLERTKQYITGGSGSQHYGESYGEPYELSNEGSYSETCAAIATVMLGWRLLLATGEARFADGIERVLFNGFLAGVSMGGGEYFYINTLLTSAQGSVLGHDRTERSPWYECACCPPNVMRLLASAHHYWATLDDHGLRLHQHGSAHVTAPLAQGQVAVRTESDYPWAGRIIVEIEEPGEAPWRLGLRVPPWAGTPSVSVAGSALDHRIEDGYLYVERGWQAGDRVEVVFDVSPRLIQANPRVDADRASAAIEVGPLVYCLEQHDQEAGVDVRDVEIDTSAPLSAAWRADELGGIAVVSATGRQREPGPGLDRLYAAIGTWEQAPRRDVSLTGIPYYAWANRGRNAMRVWIPVTAQRSEAFEQGGDSR